MAFMAKASGEIFSNRVFSIATMGGQPAMVPIAQLHFSIITVNSVPLCRGGGGNLHTPNENQSTTQSFLSKNHLPKPFLNLKAKIDQKLKFFVQKLKSVGQVFHSSS